MFVRLFSFGSPLWTSHQFPENSYIFFLFRLLSVTPTPISICWTCILFVLTEHFPLGSEHFREDVDFPCHVTEVSCWNSNECLPCCKRWMYVMTQKKAVYHNTNAGPWRRLIAWTCPGLGWGTICFTSLAIAWPLMGQRNPAHL